MSAIHPHHQHHVRSPFARLAADHPGAVQLGRAGWLAKGAVYFIAGVLAFNLGLRGRGWSTGTDQEASPTGAIKTVATTTGGPLLLWLLAIGLLLYAAWRLLSALLPGDGDAKAWVQRFGYVVSAAVYGALGVVAISFARADSPSASSASTNGNTQVSSTSSGVMSHGGGRLLVGAVGIVILAVGLYRIGKGAREDVADELDLSGMSPQRITWTRRLGALGEIGRGVGFGLVGFFLLRAAITYDPNEATGVDGALRRLASESWGTIVVLLIALGFVAYGLFCITTFTHRRLEAP